MGFGKGPRFQITIMPYVPNKIAQDIEMKKKVLKTYFRASELKGLVELHNAPYSFSGLYNLVNERMWGLVRNVEDEK
jgi:hypothetical protein